MKIKRKKNNRNNPTFKIWLSLGILIAILTIGTTGFAIIEKWNLFDSLYMTVITLSTIGFGEIRPLSRAGRLFTMFLVAGGMTAAVYAAQSATRLIVEGEVRKFIGRRKMERSVQKLKDHYILCGYGRTGRKICEALKWEELPFVVIDRSSDKVIELEEKGIFVIHGEATSDDVLLSAGVQQAKVLISAVDSPADNVFIILTARGFNNNLHIVARAEGKDSEKKMYRAGADIVVLPHSIGGQRMALAALRPSVVKFLELAFLEEKFGVQLEEIRLAPDSDLCGLSLKEAAISQRFGLVVIGVIGATQKVVFNPGSNTVLESGDDLILFGSDEQVARLENVAIGKSKLDERV